MLNLQETGSGQPVVLIHGFPFNHHLWDGFVAHLDPAFRVITPDLPGFGASAGLAAGFTIDDVARSVAGALRQNNITRAAVVGHSLGGYVALAMADLEPDLVSSLILFHSTSLPDTDEKKESRNKVLDFVERNGALAFTAGFIPPLFADARHPAIDAVRNIASQADDDAVKGYVKAMRDRPDRRSLLKRLPKPVLIISGALDQGIPVESVREQASLSPRIKTQILPEIAHMGMFENPVETARIISNFLSESNRL